MTKILSLSPLPKGALDMYIGPYLAGLNVELITVDSVATEQLQKEIDDADILLGDFTFNRTITAQTIQNATKLKLIQQPSVGYQHIDIEACREKKIPVANAAGANDKSVAEHTILLALMLLKKVLYFHERTKTGAWRQMEAFDVGVFELFSKKWGIVGMGRIGREVAKRLNAFEVQVHYFDVNRLSADEEAKLQLTYMPLEKLLRKVDIISLHVPLMATTRHMINAQTLAYMKPSSLLINVARGELVDELALLEALNSKRLAGAGIDVFSTEPTQPDLPILQAKNVVLTPHIAGMTNEARGRIIEVSEDIWRERSEINEKEFCFELPPALAPDENDLLEILAALQKSSRPLILAGCGVAYAHASPALVRLAESLNIPVITTGNGRGVINEDHALVLGRVGFGGGSPVADAAFGQCDCLVTIGCGVSDMATYEYSASTDADIYMINLDPQSAKKPIYVEKHVYCDAGLALNALNRLVTEKKIPIHESWLNQLDEVRTNWRTLLQMSAEQIKSPLSPSTVFSSLDKLLSPDAITCGGAGMHVVYANDYLKARGPLQFLAAVNFGAMGFGMAAAMAAKLHYPNREVIAVLGDGEFVMAMQDLETIVREKLAVKIFIVNDNSYRVLEFKQRLNYQGHVIGTHHANPDFMKLAEAFGLPGIRLEKPEEVMPGLQRALKETGPVLVEIVTDPEDLPPTNVDATIRMGQV